MREKTRKPAKLPVFGLFLYFFHILRRIFFGGETIISLYSDGARRQTADSSAHEIQFLIVERSHIRFTEAGLWPQCPLPGSRR